jgi:hypothetical protein
VEIMPTPPSPPAGPFPPHARLAAVMTAPMALMPAVLAWQEWAAGDRLATWAGAAVAALAMAGAVAGIDALMRPHGA